jgi:LEA14-like dessication related protein
MYAFYKKQIAAALNYCYKISKVKINNVAKNDIDLDVTVKIRNNSEFILNVTKYSMNVAINGAIVANIASNTPQIIQNKGVSEIVMKVKFDPAKFFKDSDILGIVIAATTNRKAFIISVNGSLSAKMNFLSLTNIPIDISMTLDEILKPASSGTSTGKGQESGVVTEKCTV